MLPDNVLLAIFNFYVDEDVDEDLESFGKQRIEEWITLAHVCRRWRSVVFQSPRRLNLRLVCTTKTRANTLDVWPPLPLIIRDFDDIFDDNPSSVHVDNIIAALEHNDRVRRIQLYSFSSSELEYITDSAAMQKPFPELANLRLDICGYDGSELPDSFLGGTAPRLQSLVP
jgi:hypothetical protein